MFSLNKASTLGLFIILLSLINDVVGTNVYVWGVNNYGQLGLGSYSSFEPNPTLNPTYQTLSVDSIVAGPNYHIATLTDGSVYSCGINFYGQLTLKTSVPSVNVPTPASSLNLIQNPPNLTIDIYATSGSAVGLSTSGNLYGWGSFAAFLKGRKGFNDIQWANPALLTAYAGQVASASVVYEATFFTLKDGRSFVAGINDNGRLGIDKAGQNFTDITPFTFFTSRGLNVDIPSTSSDSVFAIDRSNGTVYAWGANGQGQLGLGDTSDRYAPVYVSALAQYWHVLQIFPGGNHTLALTCNGHVLAWGSNLYGQIGQYDTINASYSLPQVVLGAIDKDIVEIVTGANVNYARSADNRWYVWGANANGALGFGVNQNSSNYNATDIYTPTENALFELLDINHIVIATAGLSAYGWRLKDAASTLACPIQAQLFDECAANQKVCGTNAICIDADYGAFCQCPHNYYGDPTTLCSPINYCASNIAYCDPAATCSYDAITGSSCTCNAGFGDGRNKIYGGSGCTAYPANCTTELCTANAFCFVSGGRAYCNCSSGYAGDGYVNQNYRPSGQPLEDACSDIDECAATPSPCPANSACNNTQGSYVCSCNVGSTLSNFVCVEDICNSNYTSCAAGSNCTADQLGEFCSCPTGYYGDGRSTSLGGSGCTAIPVDTTGSSSTVTSGTTTGQSNGTISASSSTASTSTSTGGTTPSPGLESTDLDIYDDGQYTGKAGVDPYSQPQAGFFGAILNQVTAAPSNNNQGHTAGQKAALGITISIFVILAALALALGVHLYRTRYNHLRTPIRYTNNPDNVVY